MPKLSLNASKKTKHTPAGEIPVDWGWSKIGALGKVQTGRQKSPSFIKGTVRPYLRVANVFEGRLSLEDVKAMKFTDAEYNQFLLKNGDILLNEGQSLELVGRAAMYKGLPSDCCFQNTLIRFQAGESITPEFSLCLFHYFLHSGKFAAIASQTTSIAHLGTSRFAALPAPVPPLPEQRRIADILTTWDRAIETLESLIAAKERRKQALMEQLLSGRKRLPGFTKDGWKKLRMKEILERVFRPIDWHADKQLSLVSLRRRCGGLFRRPDMLGSEYKTQDLHELKTDDFLISKRQVSHGAWGIVPSEFEGSHVSKEYAIFVNKDSSKLHMSFFAWLAQTPRMIRLARVASTGVHIEKLIFDPVVFLRESISIPPTIKEQQQIASILDTADRELTLHRQHLATLRTQKRGLMQLLLTGQIRTR